MITFSINKFFFGYFSEILIDKVAFITGTQTLLSIRSSLPFLWYTKCLNHGILYDLFSSYFRNQQLYQCPGRKIRIKDAKNWMKIPGILFIIEYQPN